MGKFSVLAVSGLALVFGLIGCSKNAESTSTEGGSTTVAGGGSAKGETSISIDGSSTVLPISEAIADGFQEGKKDVKVSVAGSGTGGGFKKFANGELDITGASRPIEEKEIAACKEKGIEFIEIPIAFDGLTVVVSKDNAALNDITSAELKKLWEPDSKVKTWADLRAGLPADPVKLFGPGTDSGTFDYFCEAINGKKGASRKDYSPSEDDNTLVVGVAGDKAALGYFGFAYYESNIDKLKALKVDGVEPTEETIRNGTYKPLSRPLFWYVNVKSLEKPGVKEIVEYMIEQAPEKVKKAKYIPLPAEAYKLAKAHFDAKKTGSIFKDAKPGMKIEDLLKIEEKDAAAK